MATMEPSARPELSGPDSCSDLDQPPPQPWWSPHSNMCGAAPVHRLCPSSDSQAPCLTDRPQQVAQLLLPDTRPQRQGVRNREVDPGAWDTSSWKGHHNPLPVLARREAQAGLSLEKPACPEGLVPCLMGSPGSGPLPQHSLIFSSDWS